MAEVGTDEAKRGAPWMLMLIMLLVAVIIGWWLWSSRTRGEPTTGMPNTTVADSAAAVPPSP